MNNTSYAYVLFELRGSKEDIVGVYSTPELAEQDAVAMHLNQWFTLTRQYK